MLRKSGDFNLVYRKGVRYSGRGFTFIVLKNERSHSRLGVSIHRRLKGAVKRNRIKRIIRESFRLCRKDYPECCDIIVTIRPDFNLSSPAAVTEAVVALVGNTTNDQ